MSDVAAVTFCPSDKHSFKFDGVTRLWQCQKCPAAQPNCPPDLHDWAFQEHSSWLCNTCGTTSEFCSLDKHTWRFGTRELGIRSHWECVNCKATQSRNEVPQPVEEEIPVPGTE